MISWLSPLAAQACDEPGGRPRTQLRMTLPTLRLLSVDPPAPSGVAFILLALSAVSFDGLSRTFAWLALLGVNPLDYPGRSALVAPNTAGLVALATLLALGYVVVVWLADRMAPMRAATGRLLGTFVLAIVPIAFGYHFAHYLPVYLVDVQYALRALSDPFGRGWNLVGTADLYVMTGFLSEASSVYRIWHTQVAIIVGAHVAAVYLAHVLALRLTASPRAAARSQAPMLGLMIGYTLLGLWLLAASDPTRGLGTIAMFAVLVGFSAATQDIAVDALAVSLLEERELGPANALQVVGYKLGMVIGLLVAIYQTFFLIWTRMTVRRQLADRERRRIVAGRDVG